MSYTETRIFRKDGLFGGNEYKNSHGFAPYIWDKLYKRYVFAPKLSELGFGEPWQHINRAWITDSESVWALAKDRRLSFVERGVLETTFDHCLIDQRNLKRVAEFFDRFLEMHPHEDRLVCHLEGIAKEFLELSEDQSVVAVGLYVTSLSDDPWEDYYERSFDGMDEEDIRKMLTDDGNGWFLDLSEFAINRVDSGF